MTHEATTPSATLTDLIELFKAREAAGLVKYGTTVDRDDLSLADWLQHALEESMDKPIYLMRALKKLRASQPAEQPRGDAGLLRFAANVIELYDDATMRGNYMIDSKDAAGILRALAESPYATQPNPEQALGDGVVSLADAEGVAQMAYIAGKRGYTFDGFVAELRAKSTRRPAPVEVGDGVAHVPVAGWWWRLFEDGKEESYDEGFIFAHEYPEGAHPNLRARKGTHYEYRELIGREKAIKAAGGAQ